MKSREHEEFAEECSQSRFGHWPSLPGEDRPENDQEKGRNGRRRIDIYLISINHSITGHRRTYVYAVSVEKTNSRYYASWFVAINSTKSPHRLQ